MAESMEEEEQQEQEEVLEEEEEAYTSQGTPPTLTVTSSWLAVSRYSPLMVMTVPPAAGPLAGSTVVGLGSWQRQTGGATNLSVKPVFNI